MRTVAGGGLRTSNILRSYASSEQLEPGRREQVVSDGDALSPSRHVVYNICIPNQTCWPADASTSGRDRRPSR